MTDDQVAPTADLLQRCDESPLATVYCGEAAWGRREEIAILAGNRSGFVVLPWTPAARLWALAELATRRLNDGQSDDLATLQPYYLRMPTIGAPRRRDLVRQGRPSSS